MTGQEAALRDLAAAWKKRADRDKVHADYMAEQAGKTYPAEEWPELLHRAQATIRETCALKRNENRGVPAHAHFTRLSGRLCEKKSESPPPPTARHTSTPGRKKAQRFPQKTGQALLAAARFTAWTMKGRPLLPGPQLRDRGTQTFPQRGA